jgi:hypothetical protein
LPQWRDEQWSLLIPHEGMILRSRPRGKRMKSKWSLLLLIAGLTISSLAYAADVNGTWKISIESETSKSSSTLVLKNDGAVITGTYQGQFSDAPLTGTLKGNEILIAFKTETQGVPLDITYVGTVVGDTMTGTVNVLGFGEGTFKGVRQ